MRDNNNIFKVTKNTDDNCMFMCSADRPFAMIYLIFYIVILVYIFLRYVAGLFYKNVAFSQVRGL